jgi:hypothetical protein
VLAITWAFVVSALQVTPAAMAYFQQVHKGVQSLYASFQVIQLKLSKFPPESTLVAAVDQLKPEVSY